MKHSSIDIQSVIDHAKLTPTHWRVLFWCTLIILFDGYDLVIYGSGTAPPDGGLAVERRDSRLRQPVIWAVRPWSE